MAEWEEKLSAILGNPQAMSQIMSIAQSLGGGKEPPPEEAPPPVQAEEAPGGNEGGPSLDPRFMAAGMRAMAAFQDKDDRRGALLLALRPFVKESRHAKVDRAIQIAKLSRVVRAALDGFKGEGDYV